VTLTSWSRPLGNMGADTRKRAIEGGQPLDHERRCPRRGLDGVHGATLRRFRAKFECARGAFDLCHRPSPMELH
jgi:hypothetical protein